MKYSIKTNFLKNSCFDNMPEWHKIWDSYSMKHNKVLIPKGVVRMLSIIYMYKCKIITPEVSEMGWGYTQKNIVIKLLNCREGIHTWSLHFVNVSHTNVYWQDPYIGFSCCGFFFNVHGKCPTFKFFLVFMTFMTDLYICLFKSIHNNVCNRSYLSRKVLFLKFTRNKLIFFRFLILHNMYIDKIRTLVFPVVVFFSMCMENVQLLSFS
jgi:hypothetical protein